MTCCLVVIARAPEPGRVKTRLAAAIGDDRALAVYRALLARTAAAAARWGGPVLVAATGATAAWHDAPLARHERIPQADGGLGSRIAAALAAGLERAPRAVAIGTDCPAIDHRVLAAVVAQLDDHDVGIGPARDGGYWSIAVASPRPLPVIGDDALPWSTSALLAATLDACTAAGLRAGLGRRLDDLDTRQDLDAACAAGLLPRSLLP